MEAIDNLHLPYRSFHPEGTPTVGRLLATKSNLYGVAHRKRQCLHTWYERRRRERRRWQAKVFRTYERTVIWGGGKSQLLVPHQPRPSRLDG